MKNSLEFYKHASLIAVLALSLGLVYSAAAIQDASELDVLASRIEDCCVRMQEVSAQLQECARVVTQQEQNNKKRSVLQGMVGHFNSDKDWKALTSGLKGVLNNIPETHKQLVNLGHEETFPLSQVVDEEYLELLRVLLDHGLAVNMAIRDFDRQTMLHLAAMHGRLAVAQLLLARGADVHARNRYSNTPFIEAAAGNHLSLLRLLASYGADVNAAGDGGRTALHVATLHDHLPIIEFLAEVGGDVEAKDRWGQTSLHLAAFEGRLPATELLLQQGADVATRDQDGLVPLHIAAFGGHLEVARSLVEAGADPDATDLRGRTSLHKAAYGGHLPLVRYLVDSGASVSQRDQANNTALNLAVIEDHADVVEFLSTSGSRAWIIIDNDQE